MKVCSVEGCGGHHWARGLCCAHYFQHRAAQKKAGEWVNRPKLKNRVCSIEGCGGKYLAKGLCQKHYTRVIKKMNREFYEVVEAGEKSVRIREIDSKVVPSSERTQERVVPEPGKYVGQAMVKMVGPGGRVKVRSFAWAHKWDGTPQCQTAFGCGH